MSFTEGQHVTHISDWGRNGTITYRHAIVYSCGKKQMVLTDAATGAEIGRHFQPVAGVFFGTFPRMEDDAAIAQCLVAAEHLLSVERARYAKCLAAGKSDAYNRAVQKDLDALHGPRAIEYSSAVAGIRAAIEARG